ncbi:M16 family metallopeptidase [Nitratireductor sp. GCM10026969]|uniref:M16 family metallopeptidase n=1 Tax=Nitratireductor sp. GCM10026969 TaxID=3252645 RepID=UPI003611B1DB
MLSLKLFSARTAGFLIFLLFSSAPSAFADAVETESFQLDNGLQVVVIPQRRVPLVAHMLWYKVGSADEPAGQSGIAHLFEHLMFKETATNAAGELSKAVKRVGGELNAFTTQDFTAYYEFIPSDALGQMMAFEADRMRNLVLDQKNLDSEREVVLEERALNIDNRPGGIVEEGLMAALFQNHPYGKDIIGWRHEIEAITRDQLVEFYNRHYTPNNAVLVVVGDVDVATVRTLVEETYGKIDRGPDLPPRSRPTEPEPRTLRSVSLSDPRVGLPTLSRRWFAPAFFPDAHEEADALLVFGEILGGGPRSRLYRELVVNTRIASDASAAFHAGLLDYSIFSVDATPLKAGDLPEVERAIEAEIARIVEEGVPEKELETAKKALASRLTFAEDELLERAYQYGQVLVAGGTTADLGRMRERIDAVTADEIRAVAETYLNARTAVTGYLLPEEEEKQ